MMITLYICHPERRLVLPAFPPERRFGCRADEPQSKNPYAAANPSSPKGSFDSSVAAAISSLRMTQRGCQPGLTTLQDARWLLEVTDMGQTIVEKIAQAHMAEGPDRPLRAGDFLSIRPYHVMTHDNTSAVMKKFKAIGAKKVHDPAQPVITADHDIQNKEESNLAKYRSMEAFALEQGIDFYPPGTGIGHQIMVEQGYVLPGTFVVASDSHSNMYGALGAIGTPVVRTDAAAIWATGEFWWQVPRTVQVVLEGKLAPGATGKDVIVTLCGLYNQEEVLNAAVEFTGPGVASLSMDARLSIANMSTEWGTLVGWFPWMG